MSSAHWQRLDAELAAWQRDGRRPALWWRDDDVVARTDALDRLLDAAAAAAVRVVLAAIPEMCSPDLPPYLATRTGVRVAPHGWAHANHAPAGQKKAELGAGRPLDAVLNDVRRGWELIYAAFGEMALPLAVPPWNRFHPDLPGRLATTGVAALSGFGGRPAGGSVPRVDTHVDPIFWKGDRSFLGEVETADRLVAALAAARMTGSGEPVGLLSHHLVETAETLAFMAALAPRFRDGGGVFLDGTAVLGAAVGERWAA